MTPADDAAMFTTLRLGMVDSQLRARGIRDQRVLDAMARVPRHEFVPESYRNQAYEDHPLPIGEDQTISQPYIVAVMLDALALSPTDRVLEIGTGSGYVTALLAEMTAQVVSVERHPALAAAARELITALGYQNVWIVVGDGSRGFAESAPYNAIIVSAAAPALPAVLIGQLADGGRMIIPVGTAGSQQLQFVEMKSGEAKITPREMCRFVPLVSEKES